MTVITGSHYVLRSWACTQGPFLIKELELKAKHCLSNRLTKLWIGALEDSPGLSV